MDATTFVLLVRHGENDYVTTHRLAGRTPAVHLNEKGRSQAQQLVAYLDQQPIRAVYSSPIERCLETAAPLATSLGLPVFEDAGLLEVDFGEWQGADLRELSKLDAWQRVQHYPSLFRFPAGETLREVQARAVSTVERIRDHHPNEVVAVFSHGDVIRTTLAHYLGVPLDLFQRIAISTAAVSVLAFMDGRPMVLGVNFTATLPKFEIKKPEPEPQAASAGGDGAQTAIA